VFSDHTNGAGNWEAEASRKAAAEIAGRNGILKIMVAHCSRREGQVKKTVVVPWTT